MRTDDLDYDLPDDLIAQAPTEQRDHARLLVAQRDGSTPTHWSVFELPHLLRHGDLLVFNNSRVIPARFFGTRLKTTGRVEGLYIETVRDGAWRVMLKSGGKPAAGERITLDDAHALELLDKREDGSWIARLHGPLETRPLLEAIGQMPLPPYIHRGAQSAPGDPHETDRERYQTVYADRPGAIAAPTAGLHYTQKLLKNLRDKGVETAFLTLHVGPGTFAPVRTDMLEEHAMHSEHFTVPTAALKAVTAARREGRRIIAVGTTSVRALESLPVAFDVERDYEADTRLLIQPGFEFRFTDGLMTNFHLPRSTLLALVAALTGLDRLKELYHLAIAERYRFYSYGDAMLVLPR